MATIVDFSTTGTNYIPALKAAGITDVIRYFNSIGPRQSKVIQRAEALAYRAAGIRVAITHEGYGDRKSSYTEANGYFDAHYCRDAALEIGMPNGAPVFFACDLDFQPSDITPYVAPYFRGVARAFAEARNVPKLSISAYGDGTVLEWLIATYAPPFHWTAGATGWSGTRAFLASGKWIVRQVVPGVPASIGGLSVDTNIINPATAAHGWGSFVPFGDTLPLILPALTPSTVCFHSRGTDVMLLQRELKLEDVDGVFGPITDMAVRAWQSAHGLTVDGIVGPLTWASILGTD